MNKTRKITLLAFTIFLFTALAIPIIPTKAAYSGPRIYLEPSNYIYDTTNASVGTKFNVTIWIENVTTSDPGLDGWQIELHYDDSIINVTSDTNGVRAWPSVLRGANKFNTQYVFYNAIVVGSSLTQPVYGHIGPKNGYVLTADVIMIGTPFKGKGILSIMEFEIKALPLSGKLNCTLDITNEYCWVKQGGNTDSRATFEDGYYEISVFEPPPPPAGAKISVEPAEIIDPNKVPCTYFDINITIDDVENLKSVQFNLSYSLPVIDWTGISIRKVFNQSPSKKVITGNGFIWMNLTYANANITTESPIAIVTIEFHVESLGATPLDIHDSKFVGSFGQLIPHEEYDGFFATLIQDLAITNVTVSRTWAYAGWPVNVTVTVKNKGNMPETFDVNATYDNALIGVTTVTNLPADGETTLNFTWDTTGVSEGTYTIKGMAEMLPYESNTGDNVFIDGNVDIMEFKHDVAITNVSSPYSWVFHTFAFNISVTAKNLGGYSETFDIKTYLNSSLLGTYHVVDLAPDAEITVLFLWDTTSAQPCHWYKLKAEATLVPFEYNETNNVFEDGLVKVRYIGDLTGDGRVDMEDLYIAAQAFGSYPGHPKWNPLADITKDNRVDMADIYLIARNFGKGC